MSKPNSKWFRSVRNHLSPEGIRHIYMRFEEGWPDSQIVGEMMITRSGCSQRRKMWLARKGVL